jgi:2-oxo-4-hydroxy-4-carboxy-5-ureidoimidazoline decarboxylase
MASANPTVKELLAKSQQDIINFLGGIYEHSSWVAEDLSAKPDVCSSISTVTELAACMKAIVKEASQEKKLALLVAHPDLCEKVGAGGTSALTKESQEEQSSAGLQSLTAEELERFTSLNNAYKEKFKFPFILAVRNATKHTVLSALAGRLPNSVEKEFVQAIEQVHKIAWMRLLSKLNTDDAVGFLTCHVLDTANGIPGTSIVSDDDHDYYLMYCVNPPGGLSTKLYLFLISFAIVIFIMIMIMIICTYLHSRQNEN